MGPRASTVLTAISLICLQVFFPVLVSHWVITIAKALPSFFTLGITTFLLYKLFRYPRGAVFTVLGIAQLAFTFWLGFYLWNAGLPILIIPVFLAAIVFGPKSAKATWKFLGVDRYYINKSID